MDFTKVHNAREKAKRKFQQTNGTKLSYMPFIFKSVAAVLKAHPKLNAAIDGNNVVFKKDVNLGMAVALDWGLLVPVIRNADTLNLVGLAKTANDLADRARAKKLGPDELKGGSFIQRTAGMVGDPQAQALAAEYGLNLINLTWEDTGRYYNSAVGPNISDMTIQVQHRNPVTGQYELTLMPVIRYPNFSDLTADISPDDFYLLVGNQYGEALRPVTLTEYLGNFRAYLSEPDSWAGREMSLLGGRDSHVLVSAQAAFLPVPPSGKAEFNPVLFNYQSYAGDPAVLAIVATREGTSATVIDNLRDAFPAGFSWGQRLFFNQDGERASFTGQRLSEFGGAEESGNRDDETQPGYGEGGP